MSSAPTGQSTEKIYFISDQDYHWLANSFKGKKVKYKGTTYLSAEHLFQSLKFLGYVPKNHDVKNGAEAALNDVRNSDDPLVVARSTLYEDELRPDWYDVNIRMMEVSIYCKFTQHKDLRMKLKATAGRELINNVTDPFWGVGGDDYTGLNRFGKLLEALRDKLIAHSRISEPSSPPYTGRAIEFYHKNQEYYGFTNFDPRYPVELEGVKWLTSEHLFQAFKYTDPKSQHLVDQIYDANRPTQVFAVANSPEGKASRRSDWTDISVPLMRHIVYLKMKQNTKLKTELLGTGTVELIENSDTDAFWGCGPKRDGKNQLGKALMRVRSILKHETSLPPPPLPTAAPIPSRFRK